MRAALSIFLAALTLVSNVSLSLNTHYCGGIEMETAFNFGPNIPDCGMAEMLKDCEQEPRNKPGLNSKPCCENQHQSLQLDQQNEVQKVQQDWSPNHLLACLYVIFKPLVSFEDLESNLALYVPPLPRLEINTLFQVFRI
ncbi:HYC_CC_PP family protein [Croceimicrobium sp.]|uniref:HYC_CC_PP family protein n=1 Tax=Croceimicrobium sp. TaxID=2828340 RepID=UPI003BAB54BA